MINDQIFKLVNQKTGETIERIGAFSELAAAKIKSGLLETENAIVKNVLAVKNIVAEQIRVNQLFIRENLFAQKIISPIVETTDLVATGTAQLNEIRPVNQDLVIDLSSPNLPNSPNAGALARLIIKGLEGKTAVVIDEAGNASFSGQIVADSLQINNDATVSGNLASNTLTTNEASISGKLIAGEIESSTINDIQTLLADIKNQPLPDPSNQTNLSNLTNFESITVTGNSNLYNVSVSNSLLVGTTLIDQNSIISLASELKLSALSRINLFDGAVIIARDGTITTRGEIIAQGGIRTNEIRPINPNDDVSVVLNSNEIKNSKLKIRNSLGDEVASVDASGSAYFNNLSLNKYLTATDSAAIIAAPDNFEKNGLFAPAIETATASAGLGILPENSIEVIIYNDNVQKDSLIYLTPTSLSSPVSLTIGQKQDCQSSIIYYPSSNCKSYFKVITNTPSVLPIKFNWLIIN